MDTADKFGDWVVLERPRNALKWLCRCKCGMEKPVNKYNLLSGRSANCGCTKKARVALIGKKNLRHGMDGSPTYRSWVEMRRRCRDSTRKEGQRYADRGISVHPEWESFEAFYRDMGERPSLQHTLDRKNNDGNYEPDNCRWATGTEQANNRNGNRFVLVDGTRMTVAQAVAKTGLSRGYWRRRTVD